MIFRCLAMLLKQQKNQNHIQLLSFSYVSFFFLLFLLLSESYTIAYNAANEEAVAAFLDKKTGFTAIPRIVRSVLDKDWTYEPRSFDDVFEQDKKARKLAQEMI